VTVTEQSGGTANFKFQTTISLFQCFNLLRLLCDVSRRGRQTFQAAVAQAAGQTVRDASPFSATEVEFPECEESPDLPESQAHIGPGVFAVQETDERRISFTSLVMSVFDYCGHVSFDIHVKLRLMVGVSAVSLCLEFIPFLPLVALLVSLYLLYRAWILVDKAVKVDEECVNLRPLTKHGNFLKDWFEWRHPE
jgi:hypothetical protein